MHEIRAERDFRTRYYHNGVDIARVYEASEFVYGLFDFFFGEGEICVRILDLGNSTKPKQLNQQKRI